MMMERPRQQPPAEALKNTNYPAPPQEAIVAPQQQQISSGQQQQKFYESHMVEIGSLPQELMQQKLAEEDNFYAMPEDQFISDSFEILSQRKRIKNRCELVDSIVGNSKAPMTEIEGTE